MNEKIIYLNKNTTVLEFIEFNRLKRREFNLKNEISTKIESNRISWDEYKDYTRELNDVQKNLIDLYFKIYHVDKENSIGISNRIIDKLIN